MRIRYSVMCVLVMVATGLSMHARLSWWPVGMITVPEQGSHYVTGRQWGNYTPSYPTELSRICASASGNLAEESREPQDMREARSLPKMKPLQEESSEMLEFSGECKSPGSCRSS